MTTGIARIPVEEVDESLMCQAAVLVTWGPPELWIACKKTTNHRFGGHPLCVIHAGTFLTYGKIVIEGGDKEMLDSGRHKT